MTDLFDKTADYFALFDLERMARLCPTELELRYLKASRTVHPDRNKNNEDAAIEASARLNGAQEVLTNPWQRYPYLAELLEPGVMARTKNLDQMFLIEAMELGERVDEVRGNAQKASSLSSEVDASLISMAHEIEDCLTPGTSLSIEKAATLCHKATYLRRALEILKREEGSDLPV